MAEGGRWQFNNLTRITILAVEIFQLQLSGFLIAKCQLWHYNFKTTFKIQFLLFFVFFGGPVTGKNQTLVPGVTPLVLVFAFLVPRPCSTSPLKTSTLFSFFLLFFNSSLVLVASFKFAGLFRLPPAKKAIRAAKGKKP